MSAKGLIIATVVFLVVSAFGSTNLSEEFAFQDGNCPIAPARLKQGDIAVVTVGDGETLNLRVFPGLDQEIITKIPPYTYVTIIAGPTCDAGYRWFEVGWEGKDGWSAEVGPDGKYNMIPNGSPMPTQEPETLPRPQTQQPDIWPDILIGVWEGKVTCLSPFIDVPGDKCDTDQRIEREPDGHLVVITERFPWNTSEQGTYKEIQASDGSSNYYYCFNLYDTYNGQTQNWGERCFRPINDYQIEMDETNPNGDTEHGVLTRVGEPVTSQPTETSPSIIEVPIETIEEPFFCGWWIIGWLACDLAEANSANARCEPQCMTEMRKRDFRPDMNEWSKGTSNSDPNDVLANAKNMTIYTMPGTDQEMQVRVREPGEGPEVGDLIIWPNDCGGANKSTGHIGQVKTIVSVIIIDVHDSNWDNTCTPMDRQIQILSCMRFVTMPFPAGTYSPVVQTPVTSCDQYQGWQNFACQYIPWWKP